MQIKRLRITGFKSFVDPADLRIEPGLTGVVGPNGCGKSNLLEALRWTMGETSAKSMRGAGMEDVIFAGTTSRPPRDFAEVSLLAEIPSATGPQETEIVRRIERGAGSAYRIDGRDVRGKDVALLFADAATGAHSPALVSQNRISAVIAARPAERRAMLEEAAGIAGLHVRRRDAEAKLRATEANLARLDEVIADQDQRLAALRRQARTAERYRLLSDQIRIAEARMVFARWRDAADAANAAKALAEQAQPFEEALLAEKSAPEDRNQVYALNFCAGSIMGSLGALASGLPQYLQEKWHWEAVASYRPLFGLTILFSIVLLFVYRAIHEDHRPRKAEKKISRATGTFVTKMSLLAIVDNFGAGMAGALVPYWFFLRFGVELKSLGVIFFASFFLAALSFLTAPVIARRIGVVKTMAFSHGLASLIYLVLPLAPSLGPAAALLIIRSFFAYMDNPLRASFTMAMVQSSERGSAAGVTSLARIVPFGVSPTISTYLMQTISLTLPLFIGGGLQLINDIAFYLMFRRMRPPEEIPLAEKLGREG